MAQYLRRHWYDFALGFAILTLTWQVFARYDGLRLILLLNLVVMFLHEYEEYHFPGGAQWVLNLTLGGERDKLDRRPLNQVNGTFNNVILWIFYLLPVIWPNLIWLGLGPVIVGVFVQFVAHAVIANVRLHSWYNPGLATTILGFIPVGIWYLVYVYQHHLIHGTDWIWSVVYAAVFLGVGIIFIGFRLMGRPFENHPFDSVEIARFDGARRRARLGLPQ
jgi:hypothetical protein